MNYYYLQLSNIKNIDRKTNQKSCIFFDKFQFNGGERHIKIQPFNFDENTRIIIEQNIFNSNDLIDLLLATDALRRMGINHIELICPYIPYARQDRVMIKGEPLSIKVFTNIINSQNYEKVYVLDPHSDVSAALINNIKLIKINYSQCFDGINFPVLVVPDAGALKKCYKIAKEYNILDIVECSKIRDVNNGKIVGTKINKNGISLEGRSCFIIDDICDGGMTFIKIAEKLRENDVANVNLIISHGIFSKGLHVFNDLIDRIYCCNCFYDIIDDKLYKISMHL